MTNTCHLRISREDFEQVYRHLYPGDKDEHGVVLLAGISLISGLPITKQNGLIWGLCGFLAICLAPAAGLPNPLAAPSVAPGAGAPRAATPGAE